MLNSLRGNDLSAPEMDQAAAHAPGRRGASGQRLDARKYDGYRMYARIDGGEIKLLTRTGLDWSHRYRRTIEPLGSLKVKSAYLDGEVRAQWRWGCRSSAASKRRWMKAARISLSSSRSISCS
jgi:hypothetical protein